MHFSPGINKAKWQAILIPGIALITSLLFALTGAQENGFTFPWQLFLTITVFTFVIWEVNLIVYKGLDRQLPFFDQPQKRFTRQVTFGLLATMGSFTILFLLMSWIFRSPFQLPVFVRFACIASGISFVVNALYIYQYLKQSIYYREQIKTNALNEQLQQVLAQQSIINTPRETIAEIKTILIDVGYKQLIVPVDEIAYFVSGDGVVTLVKSDGYKLTTNYNSFSLISNRLPPQLFFQLNRQYITHLQSIQSVTDDVNRKLIVQICAVESKSNKALVTVSRYRNPEFKQWFNTRLAGKK
jgi:LytTr DNA-binding domain